VRGGRRVYNCVTLHVGGRLDVVTARCSLSHVYFEY
jgi:hypothetical protein